MYFLLLNTNGQNHDHDHDHDHEDEDESKNSQSIVIGKLVAMGVLVIVSFIFGIIPIKVYY